jgi:ribosomal-protein-alanine N-acetyltransferase
VLYRLYKPEDFDALYALEEVCFEPPFRFGPRTMRQLVQRPHAATWIAEEAGRMAGFGLVEWTERKTGVTSYIQTIEVAPEERGRGVGSELLGRIEGSALAASAALIWLHVKAVNAGAIRLYEAQGYSCEGRQENYYPLGRAALIYLKRLDLGGQVSRPLWNATANPTLATKTRMRQGWGIQSCFACWGPDQ